MTGLFKHILVGLVGSGFAAATLLSVALAAEPEDQLVVKSGAEAEYLRWAQALWNSLDRKTGTVELLGGVAVLQVPETFYYLSPLDAQKVLVEVWGNPPSAPPLGMLFPAETTPFDNNGWGVTIEFSEEGYVSDADATDINYDELLESMQKDTDEESRYRIQQGYEGIALVGWAEPPHYDSVAKKLHWAKELRFGSSEDHTLNYNVRVLGRKGVLSLNFIADMKQLSDIDSSLGAVMGMVDFAEGHRYRDFDPSIDKVAAYGVGALIAGKVLAKAGLLAAVFIALKKFWIILLLTVGGFVWKLISGKKTADKNAAGTGTGDRTS